MRFPNKRDIYFFFQKISLGNQERVFIYWLVGLLVSVELVNQTGLLKEKAPEYDYSQLDSLISTRTAAMQAAYDSTIRFQYEPTTETMELVEQRKEEKKKKKPSNSKPKVESKPVIININTATLSEWILVPGIGEKTAQVILDYRLKNGSFQSLEDLKKVKGIGDKKLEKLRPFLKIE